MYLLLRNEKITTNLKTRSSYCDYKMNVRQIKKVVVYFMVDFFFDDHGYFLHIFTNLDAHTHTQRKLFYSGNDHGSRGRVKTYFFGK